MSWLDVLWAPLRRTILSIPLPRLLLIPSLGGSIWFVTLAGLLMTWIVRGMPRYPGQRNPDVAFISEIAAFELKAFFLVGASVTALCFVVSVAAVHVLRYEPRFAQYPPKCPDSILPDGTTTAEEPVEEDDDEGEDTNITKTLKLLSLLSILAALVAATCIILFGILDTFRYPVAHESLIRAYFTSLALQATGTAVVYGNEIVGVVAFLYHRCRWVNGWDGRNTRVRICTLRLIFK